MTLSISGWRALHLLDAELTMWVAGCIAFGVAIGVDVNHLTTVSDTVAQDGQAVEAALAAAELRRLGFDSELLTGSQRSPR